MKKGITFYFCLSAWLFVVAFSIVSAYEGEWLDFAVIGGLATWMGWDIWVNWFRKK